MFSLQCDLLSEAVQRGCIAARMPGGFCPRAARRRGRIILQRTSNQKGPVPNAADPIYLDHAATTPVRPEVVAAMTGCLEGDFGNPSSGHRWGRSARGRLDEARATVAAAMGVDPGSVCFTRGGTESDNLAVLGSVRSRIAERGPSSAHVVTSAIEHPAVMAAAARAQEEGARHTVIGFEAGFFDMDALRAALRERPSVVSCMWVNNETGLELPIGGDRCRMPQPRRSPAQRRGTGGRQDPALVRPSPGRPADGYRPQDLWPQGYGGPDRPQPAWNRATSLWRRAGGWAAAGNGRCRRRGRVGEGGASGCPGGPRRVAEAGHPQRYGSVTASATDPGLRVNGDGLPRAPHILSLAIPGVDSDTMLAALDADGIAASGGSACASGSSAPSASLAALQPGDTAAALRLSFGRLNDETQVERIATAVAGAIARVRSLWVS